MFFLKRLFPFSNLFSSFADEGDAGSGGDAGGAGDAGDAGGEGSAGFGGEGSGGNGAGSAPAPQDWRSSIADEGLRGNPSLAKFKSIEDLSKSYIEQEKFVGKGKIVLPTDEKDEAAWQQVYNKLGRPEKPDGYKLPEVQLAPEIKENFNPQIQQDFLQLAHKLGLNQKQVAGLYAWRADLAGKELAQYKEAGMKKYQDAETEMRRELGSAYQERITIAQKAASSFAKTDAQKEFIKQFGNFPGFIGIMMNAGLAVSEDTLGPGESKTFSMTPAEAEVEYQRILNDLSGPYHNEAHPEHEMTLKKMQQLAKVRLSGGQ